MRPALVLVLCLSPLAHAGGVDFEDEAAKRMKLSYDVEQVQGMLEAKPAAPARYAESYGLPRAPLPLAPNSSVDTVTVFPDRALVTRVRTVSVPAGASSVSFEGLPLGIASDSVHAEIRGGDARVVGVERTSGRGEVTESEHTQQLRSTARGLADELGQVQDRIASLLAQRAYLRATLMEQGKDQPQPAMAQLKSTLDYVGATEAEIAAKLRAEEDKASELDKKLSPLLVQLQNREATGATVRVDVEASRGGELSVALAYQVFGAGWTPAYNARLVGDKVELSYFGIVSNQTDETWKDAALVLSTANPSISGELPELSTWALGGGVSLGGLSAGAGAAVALDNTSGFSLGQGAQSAQGGEATTGFSTASQAGGAVVFAIPGRRTVAGDGSEQRLPVSTSTFPVVLEYATTPKLVSEVYRRGRIKYTGAAPLLPGTLSTFSGGDYIGSGPIDSVTPGEELLLSFGIDDRFKIERTLMSRELDHPGAGRRNLRYTFHYRLTLTSHADKPERVIVTDQLPVSETDRIEVKPLETTPAMPAGPDDPPGVLRWAVDVAPGKTAVIDLRFSVTGPADDETTAYQMDALEMAY